MPARRRYRPDVERLRAIAVLAVVLYHAHVGALGGGYVGVDVFFVLSGFLITGLLWRELEQRGGISFATFYGRRASPASCLLAGGRLDGPGLLEVALAARRQSRDQGRNRQRALMSPITGSPCSAPIT